MTTRTIITGYKHNDGYSTLMFDNLGETGPNRANIKISDKIIKIICNKTEKVCIGRYDIITGIEDSCPDKARIDKKYETCFKCREYNGFNPAFYNTNKITEKQETYNKQPHDVYLAHFGEGVLKVGISNSNRTQIRLKEQGARTAIILGTFKTAEKAREIENKISGLDGIKETIRNTTKIKYITKYYDGSIAKNDIKIMINKINDLLGYNFTLNEIYNYDEIYFPNKLNLLNLGFKDISNDKIIAIEGEFTGLCGNNLILLNQNYFILSIKTILGFVMNVDIKKINN